MTSRRQFLQAGLIASALPLAARSELAADSGVAATVPLYKVLYDTRFKASVAFARRAAARGLVVQAMGGDVTGFWYDDLYHRWRQGPAAIAGLTAHGALFCLERLAWDQRLRVLFRGEHTAGPDGCVTHRFEGPAAALADVVRVTTDAAWADALADVVAACPAGRSVRDTASMVTASARTTPAAEPLYSWVIAPVPRA